MRVVAEEEEVVSDDAEAGRKLVPRVDAGEVFHLPVAACDLAAMRLAVLARPVRDALLDDEMGGLRLPGCDGEGLALAAVTRAAEAVVPTGTTVLRVARQIGTARPRRLVRREHVIVAPVGRWGPARDAGLRSIVDETFFLVAEERVARDEETDR